MFHFFDDYRRIHFNSSTDMTRLFLINPFYKNEKGKWRLRNPFILCRFGILLTRQGKLEFRPYENADDMHLDGAIELRFPIQMIPATYDRPCCSPRMTRIAGVEWKLKWPIQYYPSHTSTISNRIESNLGMDVID